jgi:hypothetical protein
VVDLCGLDDDVDDQSSDIASLQLDTALSAVLMSQYQYQDGDGGDDASGRSSSVNVSAPRDVFMARDERAVVDNLVASNLGRGAMAEEVPSAAILDEEEGEGGPRHRHVFKRPGNYFQ